MENTMSNTDIKRSLLYRSYAQKATQSPLDTLASQQPGTVQLTDFSLVSRAGFRGANASTHISALGFSAPETPNNSTQTSSNCVLRLSNTEFWLLDTALDTPQFEKAVAAKAAPERCYSLFCQNSHAWLVLSGDHLDRVMAKLCAVDLRTSEFPVGAIAQTSVARVNAIVVHHTLNNKNVFSIFSDSASSAYLWDAIQDAMQEFNLSA